MLGGIFDDFRVFKASWDDTTRNDLKTCQHRSSHRSRHTDSREDITSAELQLAKRCHGAHIEMLQEDITEAVQQSRAGQGEVLFRQFGTYLLSVLLQLLHI